MRFRHFVLVQLLCFSPVKVTEHFFVQNRLDVLNRFSATLFELVFIEQRTQVKTFRNDDARVSSYLFTFDDESVQINFKKLVGCSQKSEIIHWWMKHSAFKLWSVGIWKNSSYDLSLGWPMISNIVSSVVFQNIWFKFTCNMQINWSLMKNITPRSYGYHPCYIIDNDLSSALS